ncbi:hypothetical protein AAV833_11335, partial [Geobacillus stearothermophilus]|uniref:hypothetical protein n=1 Tax=Geobacillus stearothermophilus TaxID=1422 RepID=UPI003D2564AF
LGRRVNAAPIWLRERRFFLIMNGGLQAGPKIQPKSMPLKACPYLMEYMFCFSLMQEEKR